MAERDLDVVVFGATGLTGGQVARYLAERAPEVGASWAAAARNPDKLQRMLGDAGVEAPETLAADVGDPGSLAAMASRARVVLNLVGPYTLYGRPVIEACVASGTHYADLTGEIPFARRMVREFHDAAQAAGAKVVEICGFEALPPDLCVRLAAEAARQRWDEELAEADLQVSTASTGGIPKPSDLLSGGTLQSLAAASGDPDAAVITDPAALIDDGAFADAVRRRSPITLAPRRDRRGTVIAPMAPAAFINPAVIHRSTVLSAEGDNVPEPFTYREGVAIGGSAPTLPLRYMAAGAISATQAAVSATARARPQIRKRIGATLTSVLPKSGFGPAPDRLDDWTWRMQLEARTTSGNEVRVEVDADGHPGYLTTARMLGEAGLLMAADGATPDRAGCLTPATALGTDCVERFKAAGMRFSVAG